MTNEKQFEQYMRQQYQWDEQFDMEPQYSQLDMEASFLAGMEAGAQREREECARIADLHLAETSGRPHGHLIAAAIRKRGGVDE